MSLTRDIYYRPALGTPDQWYATCQFQKEAASTCPGWIAPVLHLYRDPNDPTKSFVSLQDYQDGNFIRAIRDRVVFLDEDDLRDVVTQIASLLISLKSKFRRGHGHLKLTNILWVEEPGRGRRLRRIVLTDFACAPTTGGGPDRVPYESEDLRAIGVILFHILDGVDPGFEGRTAQEVLSAWQKKIKLRDSKFILETERRVHFWESLCRKLLSADNSIPSYESLLKQLGRTAVIDERFPQKKANIGVLFGAAILVILILSPVAWLMISSLRKIDSSPWPTTNVPPVALMPVSFLPSQGSYTNDVTVRLTGPTKEAAIYYTTDGTAPTTISPRYQNPLKLTNTTTVNALAWVSGEKLSAVASGTYTITKTPETVAPGSRPKPENYKDYVEVALTNSTKEAAIDDTTDGTAPTTDFPRYQISLTLTNTTVGTAPTTNSPRYQNPLKLTNTTTVNALARISGEKPSAVASGNYIVTDSPPPIPANPSSIEKQSSPPDPKLAQLLKKLDYYRYWFGVIKTPPPGLLPSQSKPWDLGKRASTSPGWSKTTKNELNQLKQDLTNFGPLSMEQEHDFQQMQESLSTAKNTRL